MSHAHASHLSDPKYGYDFVVATTQKAINSVMKKFLFENTGPRIGCAYVFRDGKEVQITLDEFHTICKTDPFKIPDGVDVKEDARIKQLNDACFIRGWCARIGLPAVQDPRSLNDLVTLSTSSENVTFKMYCAEFQIVSYVDGGRFGKDKWVNKTQEASNPWTFTSLVNLSKHMVDWKNDKAKLPKDVFDAATKLEEESHEDVFGIDQLILDLNSARLMSEAPQIDGVPKGSHEYTMLQETFLSQYFDDAKKKGNPLLSCVIKVKPRKTGDPVPTLNLTDFRYSVSPYRGEDGKVESDPTKQQQEAGTINYLCAADGHVLPEATAFSWNWVDVSELNQAHGIIAIQRNTLASHFVAQLTPYMLSMVIKPKFTYEIWKEKLTWDFSEKTMSDAGPLTKDGPTVYKLDWDSKNYTQKFQLGASYITTRVYYQCNIAFHLSTITVDQHFWFYAKVKSGVEWGEAYIIDHALTDTYHLAINHQGQLEAKCTEGTIVDNSKELRCAFWGPTFNKTVKNNITDKLQVNSPKIGHFPTSFIQNYVFPGGKAFVFKNVAFSDYQDLVSHITYADPS